ncbi:MAG: hypothetical protein AB1744_12145 [Candidatus Zixiibacteriota bacterium]
MVDYILRELRWYHIVGLVLGLVIILVLVLWLTRRELPFRNWRKAEIAE